MSSEYPKKRRPTDKEGNVSKIECRECLSPTVWIVPSSLNPLSVAVRVVIPPVYWHSYKYVSCWRSEDQAHDELRRGGLISIVLMVAMAARKL